MPSISAPSKVLVTGANGFIGSHITKALLERGFSVRGTVRDENKGEALLKLFNSDKLEYVVIPDVAAPGAFDDAVKGVDAIIQTAANMQLIGSGDPNKLVNDSIAGTVAVLESAKKYGSDVKRVLFTSSIISIFQYHDPSGAPYTYTEKDWNEVSPKAIKEKGAAADPVERYGAEKVLGERAAWDWLEANKGSIQFDITTFCPPFVFGPSLRKIKSRDDLNTSNTILLTAAKSLAPEEQLFERWASYTDIRDMAHVHVELLTREKAGNERYIACAGSFSLQDLYDALNEEPAFSGVPVGKPGATKGKVYSCRIDDSKLQALLGVPAKEIYRPFAETIRDFASQAVQDGVW
ncbi:methylglyoxal reductase (NADPH-dependent) gre2 [Tulasnella sp. 419]|nr:methylglyoxal reductase (NADPH-dependent) gre2 [Tulasnella sp. 418]KAG8948212.1 methylglyoxal reductase (NADPH-dependent) gre2 [Tulasnella sp. 419]